MALISRLQAGCGEAGDSDALIALVLRAEYYGVVLWGNWAENWIMGKKYKWRSWVMKWGLAVWWRNCRRDGKGGEEGKGDDVRGGGKNSDAEGGISRAFYN